MNQEHRTVLSMIGWCHSSDRTTSWIYQVCVVVMFNVFTLGNLIKHLVFQITPYFTLELKYLLSPTIRGQRSAQGR